jgi:hypothetical protein
MERERPPVFLSSTSDLATERAALRDALHPFYELYLYEDDQGGRKSPEATIRERIQASKVFVAVLGPSYGTPFTTSAPPKSIVEWEFDTAMAREELEVMTFVKRSSGTLVDPRQQQFIDRVTAFRSGTWCKFFESGNELVPIVRDSLTIWLLDYTHRLKQSNLAIAQWLDSRFRVITAALLILVIAVNVPPLRDMNTVAGRVTICAICFAMIAGFAGLLRTHLGGKNV